MNIQNLFPILSMRYKLNTYSQENAKHNEKMGTYDILEISTAGYKKTNKKLEQSLVDLFNFRYGEYSNIRVGHNSIIVDEVEYSQKQIPSISLERCNRIKAIDNVINIQNGKYYQFKDSNGKVHKMSCTHNRLSCPYSETKRGAHDNISSDIGNFWSLLSRDGTYIKSYYSKEEVKGYLKQAGVTEGFFTVKVGEKQQDYFYTNGTYCGPAILRSRYDVDYDAIKNDGLFRKYKANSVFEIGGEKYVMSENGDLDIPYGIDIYDIKYPPQSDLK